MGKKVTIRIAKYIFDSYEAMVIIPKKLKFDGYISEKAFEKIKSDVKEIFGKELSRMSIRLYAHVMFNTNAEIEAYWKDGYKRGQEIWREKLKEINSDCVEFTNSVERFERGEEAGLINPENMYLKVLLALNEYDYPIKSKNLARNLGVGSVREELRVLTTYGLIAHPALLKTAISRKGKRYVKKRLNLENKSDK